MGGAQAGRCVAAWFTGGLCRRDKAQAIGWGTIALSFAAVFAAPALASEIEPGRIHRQYEKSLDLPRTGKIELPTLQRQAPPANASQIRFVLKGVDIDGNSALGDEALSAPFASLIGQQVSLAQMYEASNEIAAIYWRGGYALSYAYVPAQEVKSGVVRVRVIEGYIGEVTFEESRTFHSKLWTGFVRRLMASKPLKTKDLERYLLLANDLAGVDVTARYETMDVDPESTRLVLTVDRQMINASLGVNNRGSEAIGPYRVQLGAAVNGLFGAEQRIAFLGVRVPDGEELAYLAGKFELPLTSDGLTMSVDAARVHGKVGEWPSLFDYEIDGWVGHLMFSYPITRSQDENLYATAGVTYKNLPTSVFGFENTRDIMTLLTLGATYETRDRWGASLQATGALYIGFDVLDSTASSDPGSSRPGASGQFFRLEGTVSRLQRLERWPWLQLYTEVSAQIADGSLLLSEQCGYGGGRIGRAFDPFELAGDHCLMGLAEARYDLPVERWVNSWWLNSAQAYGAFDFGFVLNSGDLLPGQKRNEGAASFGLGLRMRGMEHVSGTLEVAQPIGHGVEFDDDKKQPRVFFGLAVDY